MLGTQTFNDLQTKYITPLIGNSIVTFNGNIQVNSNLSVTDAISVSTLKSVNGGTLSMNGESTFNDILLETLKTNEIEPITGNILINGNVIIQGGNLYLGSASQISYNITPPPTNYTTHYGSLIQGTHKVTTTATSYAINLGPVARNVTNFYYNDIEVLTISINKSKASSKIMIMMNCTNETGGGGGNDNVWVIRRYNSSDVFEAELGVPTFDGSMRPTGTFPIYYDIDTGTTAIVSVFSFLDTGATNAGVYTYRFRAYAISNVRVMYINRVVDAAAIHYCERGSSTVLLEEYE
jgi:hypothetical protein